jgi:hypothetical protein
VLNTEDLTGRYSVMAVDPVLSSCHTRGLESHSSMNYTFFSKWVLRDLAYIIGRDVHFLQVLVSCCEASKMPLGQY